MCNGRRCVVNFDSGGGISASSYRLCPWCHAWPITFRRRAIFFSSNCCAYCEITGNQAKSSWSYTFYGCESLNRIEDPIAIDTLGRTLWGISLCDRRFHIRWCRWGGSESCLMTNMCLVMLLGINQCKCVHNYTTVLFNCELIIRMQNFTYSGIAGCSSLRECDAVSSCTYFPTSLLVQGGV